MKLFTYVITRDFGFAPNPFAGYCTLATCKPSVRKEATIGDWIIATGPKTSYKKQGYLFYAMRVEEKLSFNEYWNDVRFQIKKPIFNGSLKQSFGDNIYFKNKDGIWHQQDSHHSLENGGINKRNLKNDTSVPIVLISKTFYYFGQEHCLLPNEFIKNLCHNRRIPKHKVVQGEIVEKFIQWLSLNHEIGVSGLPMEFTNGFKRYDGK